MKTEQSSVVQLLVVLGNVFSEAARQMGAGKKAAPQVEVENEPPAPDAEPPAPEQEPEAPAEIVLPPKDAIADLKKAAVVDIFKSLGLKSAGLVGLQIMVDLLTGSRTMAKDYSKTDLLALADVMGIAHRKTTEQQLDEVKSGFKKWRKTVNVSVGEAAAEPDAPEAAPAAGKGKVKGKPEDAEPDADADAGTSGEPVVEPTNEKEFDELAKSLLGAEADIELDETVAGVEAWLERGVPEDHARHDAVKALLKKGKKYDAIVKCLSAQLGQVDGSYEFVADDTPYVRGDEVWCNGAPLNSTSDESVGRDFATGTCYGVVDNAIEEVADPDEKKVVKKTVKIGGKK